MNRTDLPRCPHNCRKTNPVEESTDEEFGSDPDLNTVMVVSKVFFQTSTPFLFKKPQVETIG